MRPLHWAAILGQECALQTLLDGGADRYAETAVRDLSYDRCHSFFVQLSTPAARARRIRI